MRVVWTSPARLQLAEAMEYIAEDNPLAAIMLDEEVDRVVARLKKFPLSGRTGRLEGTREVVVSPYILVYEAHSGFILITHFVHGARLFACQ